MFKLKCDDCEKCFANQGKLDDHVTRTHPKYECEDCDKIFKYETILEKHKEAAHEEIKLYCHYFNNDKDCPYDDDDGDDGCIYMHEDSVPCKFGSGCERKLCMFKHEERDDDKESESENSDGENDEDTDNDDDKESVKDLIPILEKFKDAVEKFDVLLQKCSLQLDFESKNQNVLVMHMKAKHKNNS